MKGAAGMSPWFRASGGAGIAALRAGVRQGFTSARSVEGQVAMNPDLAIGR